MFHTRVALRRGLFDTQEQIARKRDELVLSSLNARINITPAEHINEVEKWIKNTPPLLEREDKDANGLVGQKKG